MEEGLGLWIGSDPARRIELTYLRAVGNPDEGWHRFLIEACIPGFTARFGCETTLDVFKPFQDEVHAMYTTLSGVAALEFLEQGVRIYGETNRDGHVLWRIVLWSPVGPDGATLSFEIREDQTMLWNVVAKIEALIDAVGAQQSR